MKQSKKQRERLASVLHTRESRHQRMSTATKIKAAYIGSIIVWLAFLILALSKGV